MRLMKNLGVCARRVPEEDLRLDQFIGRDLYRRCLCANATPDPDFR
jgi:hypothetical protein